MLWLILALTQAAFIVAAARRERAAGLWSSSKLVFALLFAAVESALLILPIVLLDFNSPYFLPVFITAAVIALINFIPFILICRKWKLPDGRTSLQGYRDNIDSIDSSDSPPPEP